MPEDRIVEQRISAAERRYATRETLTTAGATFLTIGAKDKSDLHGRRRHGRVGRERRYGKSRAGESKATTIPKREISFMRVLVNSTNHPDLAANVSKCVSPNAVAYLSP